MRMNAMARLAGVTFAVTLIGCAAAANLVAQDQPQKLFDGTTLQGFESDGEHWRVENGAIVGEIPAGQSLNKNTWLVWRGGELADFDLRLQFKLTGLPAANSGIQFRCQVEHVDHVSGYQADLDMGATWLGRIYDEHGRALLVERGAKVDIAPDGTRRSETRAPANQFGVLFRENAWNDYRIVAVGNHIQVFVNGTLFSELRDQQVGEQDLKGSLAFQLHSGPQTRIEFRDIVLRHLAPGDQSLPPFSLKPIAATDTDHPGIVPRGPQGQDLNLGFEQGTLAGWTLTGDAFSGQPVNQDGIATRWAGQVSNKAGDYFIGGYEIVRDAGKGTLTSSPFPVTHRYASFLIGGGDTPATRVEIVRPAQGDQPEKVLFEAVGNQREQMRRVVADLQAAEDETIVIRVIDESAGGWGHLNFDDFRFHDEPPAPVEVSQAWRSIENPVLQQLVPNPVAADPAVPGSETVAQMWVPAGFSVDVVAAEPAVHQPMAFTFDAKGRLWVVEGHCYPQKRVDGEGLDRILIFADQDGDGTFESRKVFVEGLNLVSGLEVGHGGIWVGAAPQLLFIPDRDGDDQPDSAPEILLDGFGYADTHETLNSFLWGPDGWLYGNQGVFNRSAVGKPGTPEHQRQVMQAGVWRYHPTRHVFEVFAHGGSNQWGLDYDEHGQLFMTHCRSYWGRGSTTHVMQGGHYWNQVNGGYAPFISANSLPELPGMQNYLLASARYGHGEGGAGKVGSRAVYGGHSHVGTMIYLGDNWPDEYRNHLMTHNLHGHQMNQQVNLPEAGGYHTVHAGNDVLFCADPQYIGVDLKYGPDGAVYISDWYDPRHCHNPNVEHWDRGNGRLYRMKFDATYQAVQVDYTQASDDELVKAQRHPNAWHARMARLVLSQRAAQSTLSPSAVTQLKRMATEDPQATLRLRALWALHGTDNLDIVDVNRLLRDTSEHVRGWTVQLALESLSATEFTGPLRDLLSRDSSLFVRRYLACAIQRVPAALGWEIAETLAQQPENATDRDLPLLIWYGVAGLLEQDLQHGLELADTTRLPMLRNYILWYATRLSPEGRAVVAERLAQAPEPDQLQLLQLFELGVRGMRGLPAPKGWSAVAKRLYDAPDDRVAGAAESIGAAFGDDALYERMRQRLSDPNTAVPMKRRALSILSSDDSAVNLSIYLKLLDAAPLTGEVLPLLTRYDSPEVGQALVSRLPQWDAPTSAAALEVLSSRASWAGEVLDAVAAGQLEKSRLTAYYARKMASLGHEPLTQRLSKEWGTFGQSPADLRQEIDTMIAAYNRAPLWAFDAAAGATHFKNLCASCHQPAQQAENIAPNLAGSGSKGIDYLVENVIDPNAVIGRDFQAMLVQTVDGRTLSGLIVDDTETAITLRTATTTETISKDEIEELQLSEHSFMPLGLLQTLGERERIELFKYLMSL